MFWDIFISYVSEDKNLVAEPLAKELRRRGLRVWFDAFELKLGDSLRQSIDMGISLSRFGVVILSPSFFGKRWTELELSGLSQLEMDGRKVILPVWYNLSAAAVRRRSPTLADRRAADWSQGLDAVVRAIVQVVRPPGADRAGLDAAPQFTQDVPAWRDPRFVRVGLSCGFLEIRGADLRFSDGFLMALAEESHRAIAHLDPSTAPSAARSPSDPPGLDRLWSRALADHSNIEEIWDMLKLAALPAF